MSNWQEKIKQALSDRQTEDKRKFEEEQERQRRIISYDLETANLRKRRIQESRNFLERINAHEILQKAQEVWGVGNIAIKTYDWEVAAELSVVYEGIHFSDHYSGGQEVFESWTTTDRGLWRDSLLIIPESSIDLVIFDCHVFIGSQPNREFPNPNKGPLPHYSKPYKHGYSFQTARKILDENVVSLREKTKEAVLDMCIARINSHHLPSDFKGK